MKMNEFKLMLIAGHGQGDSGACGNGHREADLTRDLVNRICQIAILKGMQVDLYNPLYNAVKQIKAGNIPNFAGHNYCLEVHFNSSKKSTASGSMFYIHKDEKGWSVEEKILNKLYRLGSKKTWDGVVKSNRQWASGLLVQNRCKEQGVSHGLLETCFISNANDMVWYCENRDKIAEEIVNGIIEGFGLQAQGTTTTFKEYMVKVTDGSLNIRKNAGVQNTVVGVIKDYGSYTIVAETKTSDGETWGKLKSGAGWINLRYTRRV